MKAPNTSKLLTVVVVLQGLTLLGQWTGQASFTREARAELNLPDPGARQLAMLEELRSLNAKMDKMVGVLQSGDLQVKVAKAEEQK